MAHPATTLDATMLNQLAFRLAPLVAPLLTVTNAPQTTTVQAESILLIDVGDRRRKPARLVNRNGVLTLDASDGTAIALALVEGGSITAETLTLTDLKVTGTTDVATLTVGDTVADLTVETLHVTESLKASKTATDDWTATGKVDLSEAAVEDFSIGQITVTQKLVASNNAELATLTVEGNVDVKGETTTHTLHVEKHSNFGELEITTLKANDVNTKRIVAEEKGTFHDVETEEVKFKSDDGEVIIKVHESGVLDIPCFVATRDHEEGVGQLEGLGTTETLQVKSEWQGCFDAADHISAQINLKRVGKHISAELVPFASVVKNGGKAATLLDKLPAKWCPEQDSTFTILVIDNGKPKHGLLDIRTTGVVMIYESENRAGFTSGGRAGCEGARPFHYTSVAPAVPSGKH